MPCVYSELRGAFTWLYANMDFAADESSGGDHSGSEGLQDDDAPYPQQPLDPAVFDAAWISSIEALDSLDSAQLVMPVSEDGFLPVDWEMDQQSILGALAALGLDDRRLLLQKGDELAVVAQVLAYLGLEPGPRQVQWHRRLLTEHILKLEQAEPLAKRLRGEHLPPQLQDLLARDKVRVESSDPVPKLSVYDLLDDLPAKGLRGRNTAVAVQPPATREEAEKRLQRTWAEEFLRLLRAAEAPVIEMVADSLDPIAALHGAMGSTRGSTLESYHKALSPLRKWMESTSDQSWPSSIAQLIDFLHMAGNRPCAPTYPQRFLQAVTWFEKVGGWTGTGKLSGSDLFQNTVKFWQDELRAGIEPTRQAPRLPWSVLASLELYVCDTTKAKHKRYKAWTILLKAWGTLREDDVQHVAPAKFRVVGELLVTELLRSKTTGASKRIRQLPIAIWMGCTLTRSMWLEHGLGLMDEICEKDADYLLPSFTREGESKKTPMSYSEAAGLSRTILAELQCPYYEEESQTWTLSPEPLLGALLALLFTEHSGRPVLPTAAQCLQIAKDERNHLGRWSPGGADDYSRSYRLIVQAIQMKVRTAVLNADKRLAEVEVLDLVAVWGKRRGWDEDKISSARSLLDERFTKFWLEVKKAGGPTDETEVIPRVSIPKLPLSRALTVSNAPRFLIVYGRKRRTAKLHKVGGCPWTTIHLADSQEVAKPTPIMYNSRCKQCWPKLLKQSEEAEPGEPSSGSDF